MSGLLAKYHQKHPGRTGMKDVEMISALSRYFPGEAIRKSLQIAVNPEIAGERFGQLPAVRFAPQLSSKDSVVYQSLEQRYRDAGFAPPTVKDAIVEFGVSMKDFKEITGCSGKKANWCRWMQHCCFTTMRFRNCWTCCAIIFNQIIRFPVAEFKDLIGSTRKHAIPLLEYLDNREITQRDGDARKADAIVILCGLLISSFSVDHLTL
ncbi:MAG: SelB C-terminal domain-containing protein [Calditrichia bacterium]